MMIEPEDKEFPVAAEAVLERATSQQLYQGGFMMVNPERWTRLKDLVRFDDVVALFIPGYRQVISCPFHGRDSKPSFHIYRRTNDAYCFGCPPGKEYYDHVRFVAAMHGGSMLQALCWLEREFKLAKMADVNTEKYEEDQAEEFITVTFADLKEAFIRHAARDNAREKDLDLAKEYAEILFSAWPTRQEEKENPEAGDAMALARVLGRTSVQSILARKAYSNLSQFRFATRKHKRLTVKDDEQSEWGDS
jgi:hypothetical protein